MPSYKSPDYANFKTSINPRNRGFWDMRVTGEYYRGIDVTVYGSVVFFKQKFFNEKIEWLNEKLDFWNNIPLGITEQQMIDVQINNIPKIKKRILNIINNG